MDILLKKFPITPSAEWRMSLQPVDKNVYRSHQAYITTYSEQYLPLTQYAISEQRITASEAAELQRIYEQAGSRPILFQDPLDAYATNYQEFSGYGVTQGLVIFNNYRPYAPSLIKAYGYSVAGNIHQTIRRYLLRPIYYVENLRLYLNSPWNTPTNATLDAITRRFSTGYTFNGGSNPPTGSFNAMSSSNLQIPASFRFWQPYRITQLEITDIPKQNRAIVSGVCTEELLLSCTLEEVSWATDETPITVRRAAGGY
jgi:hypothetical protein